MLYDRWREIARAHKQEIALRDLASERSWTFAQLSQESEVEGTPGLSCPRGTSPDFILSLLRAWRTGSVVCPLEDQQPEPELDLARLPAKLIHLKLTSATTGAPSLVAFSAEQLAADAFNIVRTMGLRPEWPNLGVISLAHSYGFSNLVTPLLLHGIPLILGRALLPEQLRRALQLYPGVVLPAVPALWRTWHDAKVISPDIKLAISAGAPLALTLEREVLQESGVKLHNFYGATECGGIAYDSTNQLRSESACIGEPLHGVQVRLGPDDCLEVCSSAVGESYWPPREAELANGCYRTSDLGEICGRTLYLRGRRGDLINIAGRKLAPEQIEQTLRLHPSIKECLVFGIPSEDPQRVEEIVACLTASPSISTAEARQFLLQRLEAWQTPRLYWMVDDLAVNQRGKLSRAQWRLRYLDWRRAARDL